MSKTVHVIRAAAISLPLALAGCGMMGGGDPTNGGTAQTTGVGGQGPAAGAASQGSGGQGTGGPGAGGSAGSGGAGGGAGK